MEKQKERYWDCFQIVAVVFLVGFILLGFIYK
jgi:hypothetical protein